MEDGAAGETAGVTERVLAGCVTCCGAFNVMPVSVRTEVSVTETTRPGWGMYRDIDTSCNSSTLAVGLGLEHQTAGGYTPVRLSPKAQAVGSS